MKIFIVTDVEGVAGVVTHAMHSYADGKYYEAAKVLLTGEVNAAVDGLFEGGATEVLVVDAHGPGAIDFASLHERAELLHGRPITKRQMMQPLPDYDAMVTIGQHARHGVADGNQNHTLNSQCIDWIKINDREVGETMLNAMWGSLFGVPMIFLSGDRAACLEAEADLTGIHTAAVKRGIGLNTEICLSMMAARKLIREQSRVAMEKHRSSPVAPVDFPGPYILEMRYKSTGHADAAEDQIPAIRVDGQTVRYESDDLHAVLLACCRTKF